MTGAYDRSVALYDRSLYDRSVALCDQGMYDRRTQACKEALPTREHGRVPGHGGLDLQHSGRGLGVHDGRPMVGYLRHQARAGRAQHADAGKRRGCACCPHFMVGRVGLASKQASGGRR